MGMHCALFCGTGSVRETVSRAIRTQFLAPCAMLLGSWTVTEAFTPRIGRSVTAPCVQVTALPL